MYYQNRKNITEVECLMQLNKINNLILNKLDFKCKVYNSKDDIIEISFYPKTNCIVFDELYMTYAHYNNFIVAIKPINGTIFKLKMKLENFVICQ